METAKAPLFSRYYLVALGLIAALIIASWFGAQVMLSASVKSAAQVNVSGRQRMLSQQIALMVTQYHLTQDRWLRADLEHRIGEVSREFYRSYQRLIEGDEALGLPPAPELSEVYAQLKLPELMELHREQIKLLIQDLSDESVQDINKQLVLLEFSEHVSGELLDTYDQLTRHLQSSSEAKIADIERLDNGLLLSALILLLLEAVFIFKPMVASIHRYIASIEHQSEKLRELDKTRRKFLMNISHVLRTPLNHLQGFSRRLAQNTSGNLSDRELKAVQTIEHSAQELSETVNDLYQIVSVEGLVADSACVELSAIADWLHDYGEITTTQSNPSSQYYRVNLEALGNLLEAIQRLPGSADVCEIHWTETAKGLELRISRFEALIDGSFGQDMSVTSQLLVLELINFFKATVMSRSQPFMIECCLKRCDD